MDLTKIRKAIAGLVTPVVTAAIGWVVLHTGIGLDAATVLEIDTVLSGVITGVVVHRIPNSI